MNARKLRQIFKDTDFVHRSGTPEELQVAEYLKAQCEALGAQARIEGFRVAMAEIEEARVFADGKEIPCRGFFCCGSGTVEGELYYMPGQDKVSVAGAKDKIVLRGLFALLIVFQKEIDCMSHYLFTSESVTEGHPDKICDQISDAILDAILAQDPMGRVACETVVSTGLVHIMGEISTSCYVDIPKITREGAHAARVLKAAGIRAGDRVELDDKVLQIQAVVAPVIQRAHDNAGGIVHDQHLALEGGLADVEYFQLVRHGLFVDMDQLLVLRLGLGAVGRLITDLKEGIVFFGRLLLGMKDLIYRLVGQEPVGEKLERARLVRRKDKETPGLRRRSARHDAADREQKSRHDEKRCQQKDEDPSEQNEKPGDRALFGAIRCSRLTILCHVFLHANKISIHYSRKTRFSQDQVKTCPKSSAICI